VSVGRRYHVNLLLNLLYDALDCVFVTIYDHNGDAMDTLYRSGAGHEVPDADASSGEEAAYRYEETYLVLGEDGHRKLCLNSFHSCTILQCST